MYSEKISAFSRLVQLITSDMLCIWRTPSTSVVSTSWMFDLDYFRAINLLFNAARRKCQRALLVLPYPRSPRICVQYG